MRAGPDRRARRCAPPWRPPLSEIAKFEWAILLLIALGLGLWEMVRIRRLIRLDRERAALAKDQSARGTRKGSIS